MTAKPFRRALPATLVIVLLAAFQAHAAVPAASAKKPQPNWQEYYAVPKTALPYDQAVYYADLNSVTAHEFQGLRYYSVVTRHDIAARVTTLWNIEHVVCAGGRIEWGWAPGTSLEPARLGHPPKNPLVDRPIASLDDFGSHGDLLLHNDQVPLKENDGALLVLLVCQHVEHVRAPIKP